MYHCEAAFTFLTPCSLLDKVPERIIRLRYLTSLRIKSPELFITNYVPQRLKYFLIAGPNEVLAEAAAEGAAQGLPGLSLLHHTRPRRLQLQPVLQRPQKSAPEAFGIR